MQEVCPTVGQAIHVGYGLNGGLRIAVILCGRIDGWGTWVFRLLKPLRCLRRGRARGKPPPLL